MKLWVRRFKRLHKQRKVLLTGKHDVLITLHKKHVPVNQRLSLIPVKLNEKNSLLGIL
jgi:hypothetical protein